MYFSRVISKIISKIKGENFQLDDNIPFGYLIRIVLFKRVLMFIRGVIKFMRITPSIFIDSKCKIICKNKIYFNGVVTFDRNSYVDALSKKGITFGQNISIGMNTTIICSGTMKDIGEGLIVGNNVGLGTHCFYGCAGGIEIGDDTIFGNFISLHSENHNYKDESTLIRNQGVNRKGIKIGKNCWIGSKATILDGVIIKDGCINAAGALVTEGIYDENSIYAGVPAKFIKKRFLK